MSTDIYFYAGYRKDGKIYPLGPYTADKEYHPLYYRCGHSNLSDQFRKIEDLNSFDRSFWEATKDLEPSEPVETLDWLCVATIDYANLPKDKTFIRRGYFLRSQISDYEQYGDSDSLYGGLTEGEYARKLQKELELQRKNARKSEEDTYPCADYSYYVYPDYDSAEYETYRLKISLEGMGVEEWCPEYEGNPVVIIQIIS